MTNLFSDPKTEAVYRLYEKRVLDETALMSSLGPAGMARRDEFLLPIGEEVGRFLHALILAKRPTRILEVGTSYGYSTLFLAEAAKQIGARVTTLELAPEKQAYAREQMIAAGLDDVVDWRLGDAIEEIEKDSGQFDFVLLDIWKELYVPCLEALYPKLSDEAIIAADNMYAPSVHIEMARQYRSALAGKTDLQTTLLPIGSGIELTCRWVADSEKL